MPSGARKRKANKKKGKNGDAHNNSSNHSISSSNSSSTHSQGSEDPRLDDRESDSGEVEIADYEVGGATNGKGLSNEIIDITRETQHEKNDSVGVDFSDVVVAKEPTLGIRNTEDSIPRYGDLQDKEVVVEEEKSIVSGVKELKVPDVSSVTSVIEKKAKEEIPKQDAITAKAASIELVKDLVSFTIEVDGGFEKSITSELIDSGLVKNADPALPISNEKKKPSTLKEPQLEKTESKIVKMDEAKSSVATPVNSTSELETVKTSGTSNAASVTTTQVVESVKNKETLKQTDNQAGFTVVSTSPQVDNVKEIETQTRSTDQTLIASNPLPQRGKPCVQEPIGSYDRGIQHGLGSVPYSTAGSNRTTVDLVRDSHSSWALENPRQRSPDRVVHPSIPKPFFPERNVDEMQKVAMINSYSDGTSNLYRRTDIPSPPRANGFGAFLMHPASHAVSSLPARPMPMVVQYPQMSGFAQSIPYAVEQQPTLAGFLQSLGLEKYIIHFRAEEVDFHALKQMSDPDLKELNIPMGPRKKIIQALTPQLRRS